MSRFSPLWRWGGGALLLFWFVLPLLPIVLWSLADRWPTGDLLPTWGLVGWREAYGDHMVPALVRSAALGLIVAAIAVPIGALAGRALGWQIGGRHPWSAALLLAPIALPPFALAMGLDVLLLRLHIPQPVAVVVLLTVFAVPYTTYIVRSAYAGLDSQIEDQARMLGASATQATRKVTLPAIAPALWAAAAMAFLVGWSDYVITLIIGGGRLVTAPILVAASASGTGNEPLTSALAVAIALPLVAALLIGRLVRR